MTGERQWHVYVLRDPRDGAIRYVGWCREPRARLATHRSDARRRTHHRARWIASLLALDLEPTIHVVQRGRGDGWADAERRWIARLRAAGCDLVNATDGGETGPGFTVAACEKARATPRSHEARARMSAAQQGHVVSDTTKRKIAAKATGRTRSTASRRKQSLTNTGRPLTRAHRDAIAAGLRGHVVSQATRDKIAATLRERHA